MCETVIAKIAQMHQKVNSSHFIKISSFFSTRIRKFLLILSEFPKFLPHTELGKVNSKELFIEMKDEKASQVLEDSDQELPDV